MRKNIILIVGVAAILSACDERRNPEACFDGICIDPNLPFCDVGGEVAGQANTCIAPACTPGEFEVCRGDDAITCNSDGTNFEVLGCELGCVAPAGGCRQCTSSEQCGAALPVCETTTSTCRGCAADDECTSRVCDLAVGVCVPEDSIVYATPLGVTGTCSRTQPCSLDDAISAALLSSTHILRLLPGTYSLPLDVRPNFAATVKVIGTGAVLSPNANGGLPVAAIRVSDGSTVEIRGAAVTNPIAIACGDTNVITPARSTVVLRDSSVTVLDNTPPIESTSCNLDLIDVDLSLGASELVTSLTNSDIRLDRVRGHGTTQHHIVTSGNSSVTATNSLLESVYLSLQGSDRVTFAYSTLVSRAIDQGSLGCDAGLVDRVRFENSIIAIVGTGDAIIPGPGCTFHNTLLSRQSAPPVGSLVGDPQFVNPGLGDFHLLSSSPAVDVAVPSSEGLDPLVDLDGKPRPSGPRSDLGAFELGP